MNFKAQAFTREFFPNAPESGAGIPDDFCPSFNMGGTWQQNFDDNIGNSGIQLFGFNCAHTIGVSPPLLPTLF